LGEIYFTGVNPLPAIVAAHALTLNKTFIWNYKFSVYIFVPVLYRFLSRKAEGYGPLKP
jgi:hypothetical protein